MELCSLIVLFGTLSTGNTYDVHGRRERAAGSDAEGCKDKFKQVADHSACLPKSTKVKTSGISKEDQGLIVDEHNKYRDQVSPAASNMLKMIWDDEVAEIAQRWAENCIYKHDDNAARRIPGRFTVGQNIAAGYKDWTSVIDGWHGEVKDFRYGGASTGVVGHYTQMVWATSHRLGCGFADCTGAGRFYVCNYGPAGNGGGDPYATGSPVCGQKHRKNNLCNCENDCLNGGTWDLTDCSCSCLKNLKFYVGEQCELDCSKTNGSIPGYCGSGNFGEAGCIKYSNVPYECPLTCKVCPWAGIDYNEGTTNILPTNPLSTTTNILPTNPSSTTTNISLTNPPSTTTNISLTNPSPTNPDGMAACLTPSQVLIGLIAVIGWILSTNRLSLSTF